MFSFEDSHLKSYINTVRFPLNFVRFIRVGGGVHISNVQIFLGACTTNILKL